MAKKKHYCATSPTKKAAFGPLLTPNTDSVSQELLKPTITALLTLYISNK